MSVDNLIIRAVTPDDIPQLLSLVRELAEYEHLTDILVATEEQYREALFGECPVVEALLAVYDDKAAGYAMFFHSFSSFLGRAGIYLEDIYVRPQLRGKGIGKAMFTYIAKLTRDRKCGRMEWCVLNWNTPSIEFYKAHGAEFLSEWTMCRLTGQALEEVADEA